MFINACLVLFVCCQKLIERRKAEEYTGGSRSYRWGGRAGVLQWGTGAAEPLMESCSASAPES